MINIINTNLNIMWSIIIVSVVMFVFGAVWFTFLFGKKWAQLMDFNPAGDARAKEMGMAKPLILNFLLNIVCASVVYYLLPQLLPVSYAEFLKVALIIWLGFSFPIYANAAVWEQKSWKLVLINSAQGIISLVIATAVIYYMQ